jgi:hypothetical protein
MFLRCMWSWELMRWSGNVMIKQCVYVLLSVSLLIHFRQCDDQAMIRQTDDQAKLKNLYKWSWTVVAFSVYVLYDVWILSINACTAFFRHKLYKPEIVWTEKWRLNCPRVVLQFSDINCINLGKTVYLTKQFRPARTTCKLSTWKHILCHKNWTWTWYLRIKLILCHKNWTWEPYNN